MDYAEELRKEFERLGWDENSRRELILSFLYGGSNCPGEAGEDALTYLKRQPSPIQIMAEPC